MLVKPPKPMLVKPPKPATSLKPLSPSPKASKAKMPAKSEINVSVPIATNLTTAKEIRPEHLSPTANEMDSGCGSRAYSCRLYH